MPNSSTYLGTVQDVQGATVSVALDTGTASGLAFINGQGYRIGQIGSFVRISIGFTNLFGIVSQVGAGAARPRHLPRRLLRLTPVSLPLAFFRSIRPFGHGATALRRRRSEHAKRDPVGGRLEPNPNGQNP